MPLPRIYLAHRMPTFGTDAFDALDVAGDILGSAGHRACTPPGPRAAAGPGRRASSCSRSWAARHVHAVGHRQARGRRRSARSRAAGRDRSARDRGTDRPPSSSASEPACRRSRVRLERIAERADRLSMYACLFDEPERINAEVSRYPGVDAERVGAPCADSVRPDNRLTLTYVRRGGRQAVSRPPQRSRSPAPRGRITSRTSSAIGSPTG